VNAAEDYPQDMSVSYGKTLSIDLHSKTSRIFTIGHRNPQGLVVKSDGDLVNRIHPSTRYESTARDHLQKR
jgi:glucose/arabinose dehydrogenase